MREGIEVKLTRCPEIGEAIVLCRSADRRKKERAMYGSRLGVSAKDATSATNVVTTLLAKALICREA